MEIPSFVYLAVIFLAAFFTKKITARIKIPEVTGYVLIGVMLGVSLLHILSPETVDKLSGISTVALGIIAFIIGVELRLDVIKKLGKSVLMIVLFECLGAFAIVYLVLMALYPDNPYLALLLGSVASATAPAATIAVIKQYKAKGSLTSTIIAVVGIDDAMALIIYVFASSIVKAGLTGGHAQMIQIVGSTLLSIGESVALGTASALLFKLLLGKVRESELIMLMIAAVIMGLLGISEMLGVSELLSIMSFGCVLVNTAPQLAKKSGGLIEHFSPVFLAAFFLLGGAHLDIRLLKQIGVMGLIYFAARGAGKMGGASLGAILGKAPGRVKKYIGFTLLPQVGVALALALSISKEFTKPVYGTLGSEMATVIINILLFTTIITEIVGPLLTRFALTKAGEITTGAQE